MSTPIIVLLVVLLAVAVVAPRLRVNRLIPITCILIGYAAAEYGGFTATLEALSLWLRSVLSTIPQALLTLL